MKKAKSKLFLSLNHHCTVPSEQQSPELCFLILLSHSTANKIPFAQLSRVKDKVVCGPQETCPSDPVTQDWPGVPEGIRFDTGMTRVWQLV